jgi:hypothetical protein
MAQASRSMAKKKAAEQRKEPGRVTIVGLKGTPAFGAWVDGLCKHVRLPLPTMIEHAMIDYARAHGFEDEPPER